MSTNKFPSTSLSVGLLAVSAGCIASNSIVYAEPRLSHTGAFEDPIVQIDACVRETIKAAEIPGAALALMVDGELVYERGYGNKRHDQVSAVDAETIFPVASVQKMMTAAAVMQQVELGTVDLDGPVTNLIPELQFAGPWPAESITVSHLLTHTAAIPDVETLDCRATDENLSEWAASMSDVSLFAPPGSFWNYSNAGYQLAGLVAERASGIPYRQLMRDWVWEPAGMMATTLLPKEVVAYGNFAYGHRYRKTNKTTIVAPDDYECGWTAPSGDGFTTAGDLTRWAGLMMEGGGDVLLPSSVEEMQTRQVSSHFVPGEDYGYGIRAEPYGIFDEPYQELEIRKHGGDFRGASSYLLWAPEKRFAVAVLANREHVSGTLETTAYCALDVVLQPEWQEQPKYTTDPSTWQQYTGLYLLQTNLGDLLPVYVELVDNQLFWAQFDLDNFEVKVFPLEQDHLDTFLLQQEHRITFIETSGQSHEPTMWLRNRSLVGPRIDQGDLWSLTLTGLR